MNSPGRLCCIISMTSVICWVICCGAGGGVATCAKLNAAGTSDGAVNCGRGREKCRKLVADGGRIGVLFSTAVTFVWPVRSYSSRLRVVEGGLLKL